MRSMSTRPPCPLPFFSFVAFFFRFFLSGTVCVCPVPPCVFFLLRRRRGVCKREGAREREKKKNDRCRSPSSHNSPLFFPLPPPRAPFVLPSPWLTLYVLNPVERRERERGSELPSQASARRLPAAPDCGPPRAAPSPPLAPSLAPPLRRARTCALRGGGRAGATSGGGGGDCRHAPLRLGPPPPSDRASATRGRSPPLSPAPPSRS